MAISVLGRVAGTGGFAALASAALASGCFHPDLPGGIRCTEERACPGHLECGQGNICVDPNRVSDVDAGDSFFDAGGVEPVDGGSGRTDAGRSSASTWLELQTASSPSARSTHAMATDPARGGVVLFSGVVKPLEPAAPGDTWLWDEESWTEMDIASDATPSSRVLHAMAADTIRDVVVLFGGANPGRLDDTWEWNGSFWRARESSSLLRPSARESHAMAFDGSQVLLFGGRGDGDGTGNSLVLDDTWLWSGEGWKEATRAPSWPPARARHAMAYDVARERVVLFGGIDAAGDRFSDTWEWDGQTWEQRGIGQRAPEPRDQHMMAYDAARDQVLVFGGVNQNDDVLGDTWAWDGDTWRDVTPDSASPAARHLGGLADEPGQQRVILFGGFGEGRALDDTWSWASDH